MAPVLSEFLLRLKALVHQRRMAREMAEELAFHQAMLRAKLEREGLVAEEADLAARRRFGNAERWRERLTELWQFATLESFVRDVRFSLRLLAKSPGFTAVALLTLMLGVGANTTVFSMIDGLLLRPLDVPRSDRLAVFGFYQDSPSHYSSHHSFPLPVFRALERRHEVFESTFAFDHFGFAVKNGAGNEDVFGQYVSGNYFSALGRAPLLGRTLTETDDQPGGNPAGFGAVISEGFWNRWFNRDRDVVGKRLVVDNVAFTVVGVMPKGFIGADPTQRPEVFLPLATEAVLNGDASLTAAGIHGWWLTVMGRLQPSISIERANAQVSSISDAVLRESTSEADLIGMAEKRHFRLIAERGSAGYTDLRADFRQPLTAVFAMCGGILLLACLNLASLLMARGAARQRELATRMAMGGTPQRLMQQLMVENLLLGVAGSIGGLAIAPLVSQLLAALLLSGSADAHLDTSLDIRLFAFAALAAIATTLVSGLVPAWQATSRNLVERIKDGLNATPSGERRRVLPRVLMAVEVGLALMLVMGAGLLATSLVRLYESGEGFDPKGIENIGFSLGYVGLKDDALWRFYREMGDGISHQPGVKNVSFASIVPFTGVGWDQEYRAAAGGDQDVFQNSIAPGYFRTMRIPMFSGRDFTWDDTNAASRKIILNRTAVRLLFGDAPPLGETVKKREGKESIVYQVVGVVGDAKYENLRSPAPATAYFAMTQPDARMPPLPYDAVVRVEGPAAPLASAVRALSARMAPAAPAPVMTSMMSTLDGSLSSERMMAMLSAFFALCALMVTAIGLYGTLAYATARRTTEIGIRMALGARREQVVGLVFRQNAAAVLGGTAAGLAAALLASRALAGFLYGTSPRDPWVVAESLVALAAMASAASLLPALRAARIEPMAAIRRE